MKKLISVLLVLTLLFSMGATAFAADIDESGGSASKDVKASYEPAGAAATVYSVDVTWGSMEFTYNEASPGVWNPATHEYDDAGSASWTCEADANKITVTNHSNTAVSASLSYTPGAEYAAITGNFSKSTINLATAVGVLPENAPTDSSLLTLSGALPSTVEDDTVIGSITVTIT